HAFENAVGIAFHHAAVHEGARVAFIAVADDVFLAAAATGGLGDGAPLQSCWETGATTATEPGLGDFLDDVGGRHRREGLGERGVGGAGDAIVDVFGIDSTSAFADDVHLPREEGLRRVAGHLFRRGRVERFQDDGGIGGFDVLIKGLVVVDGDHRAVGT